VGARRAPGYVFVSVGVATDAVFTQPPLVAETAQTDFLDFASGHHMFVRSERSKLARGCGPVVENVEVLFVTDILLDVRLWNPFHFDVGV